MKILMLASSLDCGGVETHVLSLSRSLSDEGHEVTVASSGGRVADELERVGIRHVRAPLDKKSPVSIARARARLASILRRERFDVIHSHTRLASYAVCPIAKKFGVPLVTTVHASFSTSYPYRLLSRWGELSIAVSEDLRHYLCKSYSIPPENTLVIKNGIDTDAFSPARQAHGDVVRITFISRLDNDCSSIAFALCEIAKELTKTAPRVELLICGGGEKYAQINALCENTGGVVRAVGSITDVSAILHSTDIFVGVSRAALEAMSCAIPVVLAGDEGYFGILRNEKDADEASLENFCCRGYPSLSNEALLRDLTELVSLEPRERHAIGSAMRSYVLREHGLRAISEKTLSAYRRVASEGDSAEDKPAVILCGYYGFGNLGDDALLRLSIARARRVFPNLQSCAMVADPRKCARSFGVRCVRRASPIAMLRAISRSRILVFGGGTLLQDSTSLRSLIYYTAVIAVSKKLGLRVELWANGIGKPRSRLGHALLRLALRSCDRIGVRDTVSEERALSLVPRSKQKKIILEKDLALSVCASEQSRIDFLLGEAFGKGYPLPYGYAIVSVNGRMGRKSLRALYECVNCLRRSGVEILVIPLFPDEDRTESERMRRFADGRLIENVSASDMVGLSKRARLVLGMRLHSLVFARAAGACFVGFGSDEKIKSFCDDNGAPFFYV